jgi:hypothetical protein
MAGYEPVTTDVAVELAASATANLPPHDRFKAPTRFLSTCARTMVILDDNVTATEHAPLAHGPVFNGPRQRSRR